MIRQKTGNNSFLKEFNQTAILNLIRTHKALSKADLAKLTGLSPTAVGLIASSLMEKGYIHETGTGESKGGRRPVLLELKPRSFYSVGIDVDIDYTGFMMIDIKGDIIAEKLVKTPENYAYERVMEFLENETARLVDEYMVGWEKLLGIGVSVPGLIDSITKELVLAPNLKWKHKDLRADLKRFGNVPVMIENEAMASAICENWLGACQGIDNFVCINVSSGIGAGIFAHGKPYRGAGGSAGELGHIVVDENGPKCGCGNYGCLETLASTVSIAEHFKRIIRQGALSSLNSVEDLGQIDLNLIIKAAANQDVEAKRVLLESARYLGIAISNVVNTLNPSKVILGKEFVRYSDFVLDYIRGVVAGKALEYPASKVEIEASQIGEKASALGAAIIPLKALFSIN
ncbi:MAG: ROK family transcriptional regulator [Clostridia bacterium]|nr:ROK family transcriptional regulator [Clostridia bacterium]